MVTVVILGLGLMGGSLAKALRQQTSTTVISAWDPDPQALSLALTDKTIDIAAKSPVVACANADVIIFAMPPMHFAATLEVIADHIPQQALLMDMISVKQMVAEQIQTIAPKLTQQFVLAHPMCGSDKTGYAHAVDHLFENKTVILTPFANSSETMQVKAKQFWQSLGAVVHQLSADKHDEIVSMVSHLPHAIAFAFMNVVNQRCSEGEIQQYAGTGFRDFTRIAKGSPELWAQICMANKQNLLEDMHAFIKQCQEVIAFLESNDISALQLFIEN